jgi:hypothetical protein
MSAVEETLSEAWAYIDTEIITPANTWLWTHVSPAGQYLALFVLVLCMALHLVYTKEAGNNLWHQLSMLIQSYIFLL